MKKSRRAKITIVWSKPYFGVQHILNAPRSHQITVTDRGEFAEVYMLYLHGAHPFTATKEAHGTLDAMIAKGEEWAQELFD
jgi:hypothetical protein